MIKPSEVIELESKLLQKGIWFNITNNSENQEASTCWDASLKRVRLGCSKIAIFSEMKSKIGYFLKNSQKNYLLIHCRGNQRLDILKINEIIGSEFYDLKDANELKRFSNAAKGLVNPFLGMERPELLQIFDESLFAQNFIPYTMMTNASHRRWGIEFRPIDLINCLPNTMIRDIVDDSTKFRIKKHKIGILTGNSPDSGMLLWEKINSKIRENLGENNFFGDISFPEVIVQSIPEMGLSMELDLRYDVVSGVVNNAIESLCKNGATIVCIACNTTQYFSDKMKEKCSEYNADYFSMPDVLYRYLEKNQINEFDFLGINYVSDFKRWSAFKFLDSDFKLNLPSEKDIEKIVNMAFEVKRKGNLSGSSIQELCKLIDESTKCDVVIFALTELSIVYKLHSKTIKKRSQKEYFDTLSILAEAIGDSYTSEYLEVIKKQYNDK